MSEKTVSGDEKLTLFWFAFETESAFFRRVYERKNENEFQKQIKTGQFYRLTQYFHEF